MGKIFQKTSKTTAILEAAEDNSKLGKKRKRQSQDCRKDGSERGRNIKSKTLDAHRRKLSAKPRNPYANEASQIPKAKESNPFMLVSLRPLRYVLPLD